MCREQENIYNEYFQDFVNSWKSHDGIHPLYSIHDWIEERNTNLHVEINQISLEKCHPWFFDAKTGIIRNEAGSFFTINGIQQQNKNAHLLLTTLHRCKYPHAFLIFYKTEQKPDRP